MQIYVGCLPLNKLSIMKSLTFVISTVLFGAATGYAGSVTTLVESPVTVAPESSPWTGSVSFYGWIEGLKGDIGVNGELVPVDVAFSDILEKLDFTMMMAAEVGYDRWSFVADGMYADLGDSISNQAGGFTRVGLEQFVGNFLVAYEILDSNCMHFDLYAGARVNSMNVDLFHSNIATAIDREASRTWVDPVVGARFQAELPHDFFFRAFGDIGGFDVSSQLTWQALAGFGYALTDHHSVFLGYRVIGTDYDRGGFIYDIVTSGAILGYQYTF